MLYELTEDDVIFILNLPADGEYHPVKLHLTKALMQAMIVEEAAAEFERFRALVGEDADPRTFVVAWMGGTMEAELRRRGKI